MSGDCRMVGKLSLFCLVLYFTRVTQCYPWGPPPSACVSMMPVHGVGPMVTPSPYTISVSPTTYHPGDIITVTISGGSTMFKGFMLQARPVGSELHVGNFQAPANTKTLSCGEGNAVTHSTRLTVTTQVLEWTAPNSMGDIQMVATVVQSKLIFWRKIESAVTLTETAVVKMPLFIPPVGQFSLCERSGESYHVSWTNVLVGSETQVQFTVRAAIGITASKQWVAIGLSKDDEMGDDSVVDCIQQGAGPTINVQSSHNVADLNNNMVNTIPGEGVTKVSASIVDGKMECIFNRKIDVPTNDKIFDLGGGKTYRLLVAHGDVNSADAKMRHSLLTTRRPVISTAEMNFMVPGVFSTLK